MIEATTAADLVAEIRARGGRVYRYMETRIVVLTADQELAKDLVSLGAQYGFGLPEGYNRCWFTKDGSREWDIEIQAIEKKPVFDEDTGETVMPPRFPGLWTAAATPRHLQAV